MRANASGGAGLVEAVAQMRMRDGDDGGALLTYEADANVTGPLAGRRPAPDRQRRRSAPRASSSRASTARSSRPTGPAGPARPPTPAERRYLRPGPRHGPRHADPVVIALSVLAGFLLALIGVGVGRWTARR